MDYSKIIFTITYSFIIITQLNFLIRIIFKLYPIKGFLFNLTDEFIIDKDIQNRKLNIAIIFSILIILVSLFLIKTTLSNNINSSCFLFIMFIIASMNIIRYQLKKV